MAESAPRLVLGGNTFGWTSGEAESFAILDAFVELGGTTVDTADVYSVWAEGHTGGESERTIGAWLRRRGGAPPIAIGTKVSRHPQFQGLARATVLAAAEASLARLGIERIDVYYAHYDDPTVPLEETAAAFDELHRAGKIGAVGVSNYTGERIMEWIGIARRDGLVAPTVLQPHYNLVFRRHYETELLPVVESEGLAVFPYFALASGFLTGKYRTREQLAASPRERYAGPYYSERALAAVDELVSIADAHGVEPATAALAWLLSRPGVVAPIASASIVGQLAPLAAADRTSLRPDELARLDELSQGLPE